MWFKCEELRKVKVKKKGNHVVFFFFFLKKTWKIKKKWQI